MEKWEKNHHYGEISRGGTGTKQSGTCTDCVLSTGTGTGTDTHCSILDSVRILVITWSFLIRFDLFKLIIKLDFKENQTY